MDVIFTPLAERYIDKLHEYITTHSGEPRANGYIQRIVDFCKGFATCRCAERGETTFFPD